MDADKTRGVELVLEILHRFANEMLAVADDELGIRTARDDAVDVRHRDEADLAPRLDRNALDEAGCGMGDAGCGNSVFWGVSFLQNGQQLVAQLVDCFQSRDAPSALKGFPEAVVVERLDEIIDR